MTAMYVPILGVERTQLAGLAATSGRVKAALTPLFDVLPSEAVRDGQVRDLAALVEPIAAIASAWGPGQPAYLDCLRTGRGDERLADGRVFLAALLDQAAKCSLSLVPVTGLRRPDAYQLAVADAAGDDARGACLRLELPDFQTAEGVEHGVDGFLQTVGLAPESLDLVVDLDDIGHAPVGLLEVTVRAVLRPLARLAPWRSLTLAGCAASLHGVARTVERTDWLLWRALARGASTLGRRLRFGDHGVRDARRLYYTHDAEWLVVDPAAPALHELARQPEFHGAAHCAGDAFLAASQAGTPDDPARWLAAATTHHLTTVVEQLDGI